MGCVWGQPPSGRFGSYCLKGCALGAEAIQKWGQGRLLEAISMRSVGFP